MTFENILNSLLNFGTSHNMIQSVDWGNGEELSDISKYPLMYIIPQPGSINRNVNNFIFDVYFLDKTQHDKSNLKYNFNDAHLYSNDLLTFFDEQSFYVNNLYIEDGSEYELIEASFNDSISGIKLNINCISNYDITCDIPLNVNTTIYYLVTFEGTPSGGTIQINGSEITGTTAILEPGEYIYDVVLEGYQPFSSSFLVTNSNVVVEYSLIPMIYYYVSGKPDVIYIGKAPFNYDLTNISGGIQVDIYDSDFFDRFNPNTRIYLGYTKDIPTLEKVVSSAPSSSSFTVMDTDVQQVWGGIAILTPFTSATYSDELTLINGYKVAGDVTSIYQSDDIVRLTDDAGNYWYDGIDVAYKSGFTSFAFYITQTTSEDYMNFVTIEKMTNIS